MSHPQLPPHRQLAVDRANLNLTQIQIYNILCENLPPVDSAAATAIGKLQLKHLLLATLQINIEKGDEYRFLVRIHNSAIGRIALQGIGGEGVGVESNVEGDICKCEIAEGGVGLDHDVNHSCAIVVEGAGPRLNLQ